MEVTPKNSLFCFALFCFFKIQKHRNKNLNQIMNHFNSNINNNSNNNNNNKRSKILCAGSRRAQEATSGN